MHYRSLENAPPEGCVRFRFNGRTIAAAPGLSIAAALLAAGEVALRRGSRSDAPHGPYCLMGACFECVVHIEGLGTCQACMTEARDGMDVLTG